MSSTDYVCTVDVTTLSLTIEAIYINKSIMQTSVKHC